MQNAVLINLFLKKNYLPLEIYKCNKECYFAYIQKQQSSTISIKVKFFQD